MIRIGADPELFVSQNGKPVSGYGLIPGTKQAPHPVDKGAVQIDGLALEFNIIPAASKAEFMTNIRTVMTELRKMVPAEFEFDIKAVAHFDPDYLNSLPPEATELGCMPDMNAYTMENNPAPDANKPLRTAAGHIHVGWTEDADIFDPAHLYSCASLAKEMDIRLGIPSVVMDRDRERRVLYGKAGAFRPKPYGMEYRVLGNFWLTADKYIDWAYQETMRAVNGLLSGKPVHSAATDIAVPKIINKYDVRHAREYIEMYRCQMV